ncbi:alpha-ketoglutarate-dependent taurine dioxygenase [Streptomyces sp. V3I8]|uniref:FCD domain-containing protein n=1 Tax=Streptomyces sp. V3I8 TaxID=3042279 RepID=UPI002784CEFC|nr:FCD domain-containing protein [Streptomyces sp. V3I8]MDQ1041298.1 alpha-ketoglutarate-dependent taurine dioxygenase [Streptomyces sp. V3I8]
MQSIDDQVKAGAPWHAPAVDDTFGTTFADHAAVTEAIRAQDAELARTRMLTHHTHDRDARIRQSVARGLFADRSAPPSPAG